ncbi:prominin-1-A-like [Sinocyclocheilus rhinocerous]|uniref:prominin-1-A-like n=1 Tax=Sinocyclocheilus rhinocerous TaxID=307959 RepID=UPI0007B9CF17|nr:PREDICTED: prominin-1-A-like [Sinocyclocheilus rhinocerous]
MWWKVGLVLVMCSGLTSSEAREEHRDSPPRNTMLRAPVETLDFGFVPSMVYETHAYYEPGPIGIVFHMVHAFLYVVQPNPFPKDLIVKMVQQNMGGIKGDDYKKPENVVLLLQAIYYELGFIVLSVLGVIFVLFMPVVGLFICVCRCCENCGGEMHQRQKKNGDCLRGFYMATLMATSVFLAVGVTIAYAANQNITNQIKSTRRLVSTNTRDLKSFANHTPVQIDYLSAQYTTAKNKVLSDLDNIGNLLGGQIHNQLEREVVPALDNALRMTAVKVEGAIKVQGEFLYSWKRNTLPDVEAPLASLDAVLKTDLSNIIQKGYSSFNNTPRLVREQTKEILSALPKVKGLLDKSGGEIVAFTKMFPVEPALENFTKFLTESQKNIEAYYPQIDQLDFYRWIGCVVICCMVVLVLTFNFLGLLCGSCGYDKNATPTTRGCLSNTGGNLLMASVGFSFIFSWVLMGVVVTSFIVGGNVEKLVCEPLANRQIFKIIDTPYMVHPTKKNFLPGMLFQDPNIDLTIGSMYRDCYENNGLYSALQLETKFNFNKFLNATVYNLELTKIFNSVNVDLQGMLLLEQEGKDNLIDFANTGIGEIDYQAYLTEVNKGVTVVDLLSYANELEAQADQLVRQRQINHFQLVIIAKFVKARGTLSQSIKLLQKTSRDLPIKVTNVLNAIEAAEYLIANNASHVVKQEADKFIKKLVGYFSQYTDWVKHSLEMEVAQCKPISNIIDSLEIVGCSFVVDSVNTFWFGLGGCCLLLIPSIILSVKLGKFYRRMDTEDVYDDDAESWN